MIQLTNINKTYNNGAPLHVLKGINLNIEQGEFVSIMGVKGWNAQVSAVDADGKLGYVQPIGADPKKVTRNMTEVYGVGAFLMGGCEIYKMAR